MNKRQRQLVNTLADMVGPVIAERPRAGGTPGLSVRMSAEDTAEVMIYGRIGGGGFFDEGGITSAALVETLSGIKASNIHVRINSGGGDVFEGVAIHTLLRRHPATVTTFVDGLAASAASFIAQAGDRIVMARNAMMMIHDGMTGGYGNADSMRRTADLLDKVSANIADMYAARAGEDAEHWRALMTVNGEDGSWFTGQEAVDAGLADEITDADEEDAPVSALMAQWSGLLTRAPENVQAHLTTLLAQEQADSAPDPDAPSSAPDAPDVPDAPDAPEDVPDIEDAPDSGDVTEDADVEDAPPVEDDFAFRFAMRMAHWHVLTSNGRLAHRAAA